MKLETTLKKYNVTAERLTLLVQESHSYRTVLVKLKWNDSGGAYLRIKKLIEQLNLDTSHFTGSLWNKGGNCFSIEEYLTNRRPVKSCWLKKRLIKEGLKRTKCETCSRSTWNNQPISLELHHKDGNRYNNNLPNLMLLCCNCHAQTKTWRNKPRKSS